MSYLRLDPARRKARPKGLHGLDPVTPDAGYRADPPDPVATGHRQRFPGAEYTADEREFLAAMDEYRRRTGRKFPMWSEALAVLIALGWRKEAGPADLPTFPIRRTTCPQT